MSSKMPSRSGLALALVTTLATLGWLAIPAWAADTGSSSSTQPSVTAPSTSDQSSIDRDIRSLGSDVSSMGKDMASSAVSGMGYQPVRAHQFLGLKVMDRAGQDVGDVKEIVLDSNHQRVGYALISADRSVGVGDRYLAVPWQALNIQQDRNSDKVHFVINMDRGQLKSAPTIDKNRWSELDNPQLKSQSDQFYGSLMHTSLSSSPSTARSSDIDQNQDVFGYTGSDRDVSGAAPSDRDVSGAAPSDRSMDRSTSAAGSDQDNLFNDRRVSKIIGSELTLSSAASSQSMSSQPSSAASSDRSMAATSDKNAEKIGKIQDLVIDNSNGSCLYAIVSYNHNVKGASGKWAALPWTILSPSADHKAFAVATDASTLQAVAFDKDALPLLIDRNFVRTINDRFNVSGGVYGFVGDAAQAGAQATTRQLQTFNGTIDSIDTTSANGVKDALHLKVKADDGQILWVYAGPKSYADQNQLKFSKGDHISFNGWKSYVDGKAVLLASDVTKGNQVLHVRDAQGSPLYQSTEMKSGSTMPSDRSTMPSDRGTTSGSDTGTQSY